MADKFKGSRVKTGLIYFISGKIISLITGFLGMLLVVRMLDIQSFAGYSVLTAFVEIVTALSGLGITHALLRYVPELFAKNYSIALGNLTRYALLIRICVLSLVSFVIVFYSDIFTSAIDFPADQHIFVVFFWVVAFRSLSHFLTQILESTLHQGYSQIAFTSASVLRLAGFCYLFLDGRFSLLYVIYVEIVCDFLCFVLLSVGLYHIIFYKDNGRSQNERDRNWLKNNLKLILRYAVEGYLQHLAILPAGGNANRVVGSGMLPVISMANYGFSLSIFEYVKKFLPSQVLVGFIRPIIFARYSERRDFTIPARLCSNFLQINLIILFLILTLLITGGVDAFYWLSGGKYGVDALYLFVLLLIALMFETHRQQLDMIVQVIEQYGILISTNLLLSASIFIAIVFVPYLGVYSFVIAQIVGLIFANYWVQRKIIETGNKSQFDWVSFRRIICIFWGAISIGLGARFLGFGWQAGLIFSSLVYIVGSYYLFLPLILNFIFELIYSASGRALLHLSGGSEVNRFAKPSIVFGILSSRNSADAISRIASLVHPHRVIVHHDFSKFPGLEINADNVEIMTEYHLTAWGDWSLVDATLSLMKKAFSYPDVTHFQLLSESCLPIKPIVQFESYLRSSGADFMIDLARMDEETLKMSHGWRYMSTIPVVRKIVNKISVMRLGHNIAYKQLASINIRFSAIRDFRYFFFGVLFSPVLLLVQEISRARLNCLNIAHISIGGQWFGVSRHGAVAIFDFLDNSPDVLTYFSKLLIPDEAFFHTIINEVVGKNSALNIRPSNHFVSWRSNGTGPDLISLSDIPSILNIEEKFFARKFAIDPMNAVKDKLP